MGRPFLKMNLDDPRIGGVRKRIDELVPWIKSQPVTQAAPQGANAFRAVSRLKLAMVRRGKAGPIGAVSARISHLRLQDFLLVGG